LKPWARDWLDLLGKYAKKRVIRLGLGAVLCVEVPTPTGLKYYRGIAWEFAAKGRILKSTIQDINRYAVYRSSVIGYTPFWMQLEPERYKLDARKQTLLDRWLI